jgi:cation diffusion facilitator family transporter
MEEAASSNLARSTIPVLTSTVRTTEWQIPKYFQVAPDGVGKEEERSAQDQRKVKAAYLSVGSNTSLLLSKLVVGISMSSVAVFSEAVHSGIDLLAALLATFAVRAAARPPDRDHAYGHGKFENVSGTIEAVLILVAAAFIVYESGRRLVSMEEISMPLLGVAVMAVSAVVNWAVSAYLFRVARETDSVALEADALHLRTDVWTSLGVMIGMAVIYFTDWYWVDPVMAIAVAVMIGRAAYRLTRRTLGDLVDAPLPPEEQEVISVILREHVGMHIGWDSVRTRRAGSDRHIDLHLHFPPSMPLAEAHDIAHHIEEDIEAALPRSIVLIHLEPCVGDCPDCPEEECEDRDEGRQPSRV